MPRAYTSLCGNIDLGTYRMRRTRLNYSFEKARGQHLAVLFFVELRNSWSFANSQREFTHSTNL